MPLALLLSRAKSPSKSTTPRDAYSRGWSVLGPHGIGNRRFWLDTSGHDWYGQPQLGAPL